ncbi:hypothetical protein F0562_023976 [Nyssa sinensis]|uniref:Uncharacterized protein n=1 Tax=Nyssa sinensis TaxID=561372 RepID=A0A5J5BJC4_9ASTE|nr:hypothetical protein F0562_023976 [Nyssa sinensis]
MVGGGVAVGDRGDTVKSFWMEDDDAVVMVALVGGCGDAAGVGSSDVGGERCWCGGGYGDGGVVEVEVEVEGAVVVDGGNGDGAAGGCYGDGWSCGGVGLWRCRLAVVTGVRGGWVMEEMMVMVATGAVAAERGDVGCCCG